MSGDKDYSSRSIDPAIQQMLGKAEELGVKTVWDRHAAMQPQCGYGETGLCCRHCLQGPCRISPFGESPTTGICGATADTMVARGLDRAIAAGTAAHSGHARHLAHTMLKLSEGKTPDYSIKDPAKLRAVAKRLGIGVDGRKDLEIAGDVARAALADFGEKESFVQWATTVVSEKRAKVLLGLGIVPKGIDFEISEIMHRTLYGVDADPVNLLLAGLRCSVADLAGCYMGTDLADILFGTPTPVATQANLGTLKADAVNIAVHGHNPVLSELIVAKAKDMEKEAKAAGAAGINVVGICCTGNEILMRHGIPSCTHSVSQEMAIVTGALDAMVVDYQCIMPSVVNVAECADTKIITTMDICKIAGADHVAFTRGTGGRQGEGDHRHGHRRLQEPQGQAGVHSGDHAEGRRRLQRRGDRRGAPASSTRRTRSSRSSTTSRPATSAASASSPAATTSRSPRTSGFVTIARKLLKENVLVVATGCGAGALMRHGFMDPANVDALCGAGLKAVLTAIGAGQRPRRPPAPGAAHGLVRRQLARRRARGRRRRATSAWTSTRSPSSPRRPRRSPRRPSRSAPTPSPPACRPTSA